MENRAPRLSPALPILAGAALLMLWTVWRTLDPRLVLHSWDFEGHVLRAHAFVTDVLGAGRLSGWFPYWHGGLPMTEVYPPLASWVLGLVLAVAGESGGRALLAILWISAVPASYRFLRRFGLGTVPSATAAVLVVALDAPRTFGVQALFWLGLLPNALGFVLSILTLAEMKALLDSPSLQCALRAGLLGGLTLLAHPFCAYWLALSSALLIAIEVPARIDARRRLGFSAVAAGAALTVGAYEWFPFLLNRNNVLVTDPFIIQTLTGTWRALASLRDAGGLPAAFLSLAGIAALGSARWRREFIFFTGVATLSFALSLGVNPLAGHLFGASQRARFEGFYLWTMLMASGFALDALSRIADVRRRVPVGIAVALLVAGIAVGGAFRARPNALAAPSAATTELKPLVEALDTRFIGGDFLLSENDRTTYRSLGSPHFFNQRLPQMDARFWDQGGGLPEGAKGSMPMFLAARAFPDGVTDGRADLARHGVRFVLTTRHESTEVLDTVGWLKRLWPAPGSARTTLALFEVSPFENRFGLSSEAAKNLTSVSYGAADGYRLEFSSGTRLSYPCETAICFHPWLAATAGNTPVALGSTADGRLSLESGPAEVRTLSIAYQPPSSVGRVRASSLAGFLLIFGISFLPFRRARP